MNRGNLILAMGLLLVLVNGITSGELKGLWSIVSNTPAPQTSIAGADSNFGQGAAQGPTVVGGNGLVPVQPLQPVSPVTGGPGLVPIHLN